MNLSHYSKMRLYLIGIVMGIADLIPGVSGGTVAFLSGIYEQLLESIQSLRIQSFKKIAWRFLLPLGGGIATSILLFSKLFLFLLLFYKGPLYGCFFGLIAASVYFCTLEAKFKSISFWLLALVGAAISFLLTLSPSHLLFGSGFFGILFAGVLATGAMLLPGISGSFLLQLLGVYPLALFALNRPTDPASFQLLLALSLGIALGFVLFSRAISFLLKRYRNPMLALLVGFMAGGLKFLWPFQEEGALLAGLLALGGFTLSILLNIKAKKRTVQSNSYLR